ncbi:MAG: cadherin repeat domain-containing protein [Thermoguttaceae bacterium]|nr:cadherin repeat domain-containing protein [Thermoguttaceae bacterium]
MRINLFSYLQKKHELALNSNTPKSRRLRLEALESRALLTASGVASAASYDLPCGPPDFETWSSQQNAIVGEQSISSGDDVVCLPNDYLPYGPQDYETWLVRQSAQTASDDVVVSVSSDDNNDAIAVGVEDSLISSAQLEDVYQRYLTDGFINEDDLDEFIEVISETFLEGDFDSDDSDDEGGTRDPIDWPLDLQYVLHSTSNTSVQGFQNPMRESYGVIGSYFDPDVVGDYLKIVVPTLPVNYMGTITVTDLSPASTISYKVYSPYGYEMTLDNSGSFNYAGGFSGGSVFFYLAPVVNSVPTTNKTIEISLGAPTCLAPSGGASYNFSYVNQSVTTTIFNDYLEFISDVDQSLSAPYPHNNDSYNLGFIYGKPTVDANNPSTNTVIKDGFATTNNGSRHLTYSITSGNENNYFKINASTGELSWNSLPTGQVYDFNITISVSDSDVPQFNYDEATVSFTVGWASFVLCVATGSGSSSNNYVETDDNLSGNDYNVGNDRYSTGHAFWRVEATSSLQNYYVALSNNNELPNVGQYHFTNANISPTDPSDLRPFVNCWGFHPFPGISPGLEDVPGSLLPDNSYTVNVYKCETISTSVFFLNVLKKARNLYNSPGSYNLRTRNCTDVALVVVESANITVNSPEALTPLGYMHTPSKLADDLLNTSLNQGGIQGTYVVGSANNY